MRTTCVRHPEKNAFLIIREWQIRFCEGDYCAAGLLSFFAYTHDWKLEQRHQAVEANNVAERHGDTRSQFEHLYQYYTYEDLNKRLLGLYSERSIPQSIKLLVKLGVLTCHRNPNPRYSFDKTTYYLFHPDICNQWIDEHYCNGEYEDPAFELRADMLSDAIGENNEDSNFCNEVAENEIPTGNITSSKVPFLHDRQSNSASPSGNSVTSYSNFASAINNNTTLKKQTKKITAVEEKNGEHFDSTMPNQKPTAAVSLNPSCLKDENLIIGEKLSECQHKYIALAINSLAASKNVSKEQLKDEINYALISKENFSACGNDFVKKLNTILKLYREDRWTTPIGLAKQKEQVIQKAKNEFQVQLSLLESEINQLKEHLAFWKERADQKQINFYQSELDRVNQALFIHQSKRPSFAQGA